MVGKHTGAERTKRQALRKEQFAKLSDEERENEIRLEIQRQRHAAGFRSVNTFKMTGTELKIARYHAIIALGGDPHASC